MGFLKKKENQLSVRQISVLQTLMTLTKEDARGNEWSGCFGPYPVGCRSGLGKQMVQNDLDTLHEMGYVGREVNGLYKVTQKGLDYFNDTTDD